MTAENETIEFDVLFVGGGPANLAGAIKLMQMARESGTELEVALIEKGAEIGSHQISGAVLNPRALVELIPDFREKNFPLEVAVREDEFWYLTRRSAYRMPLTPRYMRNKGHLVVSLVRLTRWMGEMAEEMGVNIFPGFAGTEVLYARDGATVIGVRTGNKGIGHDGMPKANFEAGIDIMAKVTVLGEGARGSLMKTMEEKLGIGGKMPHVYETGIKEVIQLPKDNYFKTSRGNDIHTMGHPLGLKVPGGGFLYEMQENRVGIGFLVGLCYEAPWLDPYKAFIEFKRHPFVARIIQGGKVIEQGARTVSTGGYNTMPQLAVDGAVFTGGAAGFQNTPALKGIHVSMKSGMLAAETIMDALDKNDYSRNALNRFAERFESSWARDEIFEGRNFAATLARKGLSKFIHLGTQYVSKGRGLIDPMVLTADHTTLNRKTSESAPIQSVAEPEYDGELYVDKLTGVYLSKTMHREDEPCHLIIHDPDLCINTCYPTYGSPCTRFCPGRVYEIELEAETSQPQLKLKPSNCLHCKTCDIKDPYQNITWTCPEGGEGPNYQLV